MKNVTVPLVKENKLKCTVSDKFITYTNYWSVAKKIKVLHFVEAKLQENNILKIKLFSNTTTVLVSTLNISFS